MKNGSHLDAKDCLTCKYRSPMFSLLSDDELRLMRDNRIPVIFRKGETIRKQGTYMSHVISVTYGMAKLYIEGTGHTNTILRIVKPTNFIGGPGIYLDQLHHFTVAAIMETHVCFIDLPTFKKILDQNKAFSEAFMKDISQNTLSVYYRLVNLTSKQVPGRMADTLLYLFEEIYGKNSFRLLLSKQDLAELSAMSRDSANKILRDFHNEGIIHLSREEIVLLDPDALNRISRSG